MKILTGEGYTLPRLAGIMNEMWAMHIGRLPNMGDTIYATGSIVTNSITTEVGCLFDEGGEHFGSLPQVHQDRLIDIVDGDGWVNVE